MSVTFKVQKKKANSLYCSMCITKVRRQGSPEQNIEHHRTVRNPQKDWEGRVREIEGARENVKWEENIPRQRSQCCPNVKQHEEGLLI